MAKNIIKSQNAIVAASNHTGSFSTFNINLNLKKCHKKKELE